MKSLHETRMTLRISQKAAGAWNVLTGDFDHVMDDDLGRWKGRVYAQVIDHGWLRKRWHNEGLVTEGFFRSNHPDAATLASWKVRGIVDVISLRPDRGAVHAFEAETCAKLGLRLRNAALTSREAPRAESLLTLLDIFDTLKRPALMHCKSGADRTGLAAALWHIHVEGAPVETARTHLSLRFLHIKASKTGVLDRVLDAYAARMRSGPITLRDWIQNEYDREQI